MRYKPFTLKNLRQVKTICLDTEHGTLKMLTGLTGNGDGIINMSGSGDGHEDDKALGFGSSSLLFVLQIMEQITKRKFCFVGEHCSVMKYQREG